MNQLLNVLGCVEFLMTDAEARGRLAEEAEESIGGIDVSPGSHAIRELVIQALDAIEAKPDKKPKV